MPSSLESFRLRATEPSGKRGVTDVVGRRLALYPQTEMNDGEWAAWWSDYYEALGDIPTAALEAGMAAWVRKPDSRFMPKPGELRHLAITVPNAAQLAYERELQQARDEAMQALPHFAPNLEAERAGPELPSEHERRIIQKMAQEALQSLSKTIAHQRAPIGPLPAVQAKVDAGGISDELRRKENR